MRVHLRHMRQLRYCTRGVRQFFAKRGFDYPDFLKNGIEAERMIATGDAMALATVRVAEDEQRGRLAAELPL